MTRQKLEIIKKINAIDMHIVCDMQLGCGFAPADAYDELYAEQYALYEQLAILSHYNNADDMLYDTRGTEPTNRCCDNTGFCGGPSCPQFYQCNS